MTDTFEKWIEWTQSDDFKAQAAALEEEKYRCKLPREKEGNFLVSDLQSQPVPTSWGPWRFIRGSNTLENQENGYDVDLEKINSLADLLFWIYQIHGKNHHAYGGCQQANDFIWALREIFPKKLLKQGSWNGSQAVQEYIKEAFPRRDVSAKLRHQILERDGFRCCDCGATPDMPGVVLEVDHRTPVSKGGSNDPSNLRTLCGDCNRGKSDRIIDYPEGHK